MTDVLVSDKPRMNNGLILFRPVFFFASCDREERGRGPEAPLYSFKTAHATAT